MLFLLAVLVVEVWTVEVDTYQVFKRNNREWSQGKGTKGERKQKPMATDHGHWKTWWPQRFPMSLLSLFYQSIICFWSVLVGLVWCKQNFEALFKCGYGLIIFLICFLLFVPGFYFPFDSFLWIFVLKSFHPILDSQTSSNGKDDKTLWKARTPVILTFQCN